MIAGSEADGWRLTEDRLSVRWELQAYRGKVRDRVQWEILDHIKLSDAMIDVVGRHGFHLTDEHRDALTELPLIVGGRGR